MKDVQGMTLEEARAEAQRLRDLVAWHRDQTYQNMCWDNDRTLWREALCESDPHGRRNPPWDECITRCVAYWKSRQEYVPEVYVTLVFAEGRRATMPANAPLRLRDGRRVIAVDARPGDALATGENVLEVVCAGGVVHFFAGVDRDDEGGRQLAWELLQTVPHGTLYDHFGGVYAFRGVCLSRLGLEPLALLRDKSFRLWAVPREYVGEGKAFHPG
jgi:hypothetical protein